MVQLSPEEIQKMTQSGKIRARVLLTGYVTGTGFRWFLHKKAEEVGATGYVRNLDSGQLEAVFEGDKNQVEAMISHARSGPENAHVSDIQIFWETPENKWNELEITY